MADIELRRLVIRAFHMNDVEFGDQNQITTDGKMTITKDGLDALAAKHSEVIEKIDIQIIKPGDHDRYTNTIMDMPSMTHTIGEYGLGGWGWTENCSNSRMNRLWRKNGFSIPSTGKPRDGTWGMPKTAQAGRHLMKNVPDPI